MTDCKVAEKEVDFPLASVNDPAVRNATIMFVALRLHPDVAISGAVQCRYHHRDSAPDGALDLKRQYHFEGHPDPDAMIADLFASLPGRVGGATVMDLSQVDVMAAIDAIGEMPFAVYAPTLH